MVRVILLAAFALGLYFPGSAIAADGEKLYKEVCGVCHGVTGKGSPLAPALKGNEFLKNATVEDLEKLILEGRARKDKVYPKIPIEMPAHPQFSNEEVQAVIEYEKTSILPE